MKHAGMHMDENKMNEEESMQEYEDVSKQILDIIAKYKEAHPEEDSYDSEENLSEGHLEENESLVIDLREDSDDSFTVDLREESEEEQQEDELDEDLVDEEVVEDDSENEDEDYESWGYLEKFLKQ